MPPSAVPSISLDSQAKKERRKSIIFIHPDLGIGGAERLILDAALALQSRGHSVTIYTSHRDPTHCFEEASDGTLDVQVRGNTVFPAHVAGRFHVLMAMLRQLHLTVSVLRERSAGNKKVVRRQGTGTGTEKDKRAGSSGKPEEGGADEDGLDEVFIVDQVPACVPVLKVFGSRTSSLSASTGKLRRRQRILFYCHFPDQLLARRDEGSLLLRVAKGWYRYPFDRFEGWAISGSDKVVVNSKFTGGVVSKVFGSGLGDVKVVYPCVDTGNWATKNDGGIDTDKGQDGVGKLWGGLKIVLSINRFERKKDIGLAIRAYHGLGDRGRKGTRLVIAGGLYSDRKVL
jgi:alpha-1,3/alpha-1,6-mannosyltransferase